MPYVKRVVVAGGVRETRKMYTGRVHTKGAKRAPHQGKTSKAQEKVNERKLEEIIRWRLNANFSYGDIHLVLHYYDKLVGLEQCAQDLKDFLALLRDYCRKHGLEWKYLAVTETKRMTNIHHHIIMPDIPIKELFKLWEKVVGEGSGNVSNKPLDRRGNHKKLAHYLIKESKSTANRYREAGKRYKRFTCAKGMIVPEPQYTEVEAATWTEDPKAGKNYILMKDENGATARSGVHEWNGWPWQEYFELWTGPGAPPGSRQKRRKTA